MAKLFLLERYDPLIITNRNFTVQRHLYSEEPILVSGEHLQVVYQNGQEGGHRSLSVGDLIELRSGLFIIMTVGFKAVKWGDRVDFMKAVPQIDYFKREQRKGIYHYYKVSGGPGRTKDGYQEVINFLNDIPIICIEINDLNDCTGTWCTYEVGIPISKEEYQVAFNKATNDKFTII